MFTRLIFGTTNAMANSDHLMGALTLTVAIIATAEVARILRLLIVLFGIWLIAAPWILHGATIVASWSSVALGIALAVLSLRRGKGTREHYAGWDRFVI